MPQSECKPTENHPTCCIHGHNALDSNGLCALGRNPVASRDTYGSTVAGRDVPSPVAPIPAYERPSAARGGSSAGDDTSAGSNGPRTIQESLLNRCPRCQSPNPALHPAVQFEGEVQVCKDVWHDS